MLESFNTSSEMQYQRLTEEEKQKRGILGRLVGIIADFKNATRNGRKYTEELSDRTFHVGVQFHPEFKSRPNRPHPLFRGFVEAALKHSQL